MNSMASIKRSKVRLPAVAALVALVIAGCGGGDEPSATETSTLPQGSEPVELDPARFTTDTDNRWWPMKPGSRWAYRETDTTGTEQKVVVEVTDKTRKIANGVEARVVRDTVTEDGEPIEVTDDWYAQDSEGNVWYLGEDTAEYENGKVSSRAGSFEAGVDGAQAGIAMPADPRPGMSYRQEYYENEAEDRAAVITVGEEQVQVPFGFFDSGVVMTRDLVPTEPKVQELKYLRPGRRTDTQRAHRRRRWPGRTGELPAGNWLGPGAASLTSPATMLNSVDLPHQDGPTIETKSPSPISMLTSRSAMTCSPPPAPR